MDSEAATLVDLLNQLQNATTSLCGKIAAKKIALNIIVPQLASLKWGVYSRADGSRVKNFLHQRLNYELCNYMTGYEFWQTVYTNLLEYNQAFCRLYTVGDRVISLQPLPSAKMSAISTDIRTVRYVHDGRKLDPLTVWHLRLNSENGLVGVKYDTELDIFTIAKQCDELASDFLTNGGDVKRLWSFAGDLNAEQLAVLKTTLQTLLSQRGHDVIIPYGLTVRDGYLNLRDSQLLETRAYNKAEILQLYGIDIENIDLRKIYNLTIVPILEMVEQSVQKYLLSPKERDQYRVQYVTAGRFRGNLNDIVTIATALKEGELATTNELRVSLLSELGLAEVDGGDQLQSPWTGSEPARLREIK